MKQHINIEELLRSSQGEVRMESGVVSQDAVFAAIALRQEKLAQARRRRMVVWSIVGGSFGALVLIFGLFLILNYFYPESFVSLNFENTKIIKEAFSVLLSSLCSPYLLVAIPILLLLGVETLLSVKRSQKENKKSVM